jgi:hypothetical protein
MATDEDAIERKKVTPYLHLVSFSVIVLRETMVVMSKLLHKLKLILLNSNM